MSKEYWCRACEEAVDEKSAVKTNKVPEWYFWVREPTKLPEFFLVCAACGEELEENEE